jgi:pimeloyl-ACP methyl ester carboxylesterase
MTHGHPLTVGARTPSYYFEEERVGKHFVLIHGAWHGGWCWAGVITELERAGHTAEAPTMPGHNPDDDRSNIRFGDYVDAIVTVLERQPEPVVLVGHSSAGFLLQAAAPKIPHKIAQIVFLNAFVLPSGMSQFDLVPPEASEGMVAAAKASPDNCVPVIEDFVRHALMATDPVELQDALLERLTPQPLALFMTKVDTGAFQNLPTPKAVVFCKDDASLPPGAYVGMAQGLGPHRFVEIEGGHETLFTNPAVVAKSLLEVAG